MVTIERHACEQEAQIDMRRVGLDIYTSYFCTYIIHLGMIEAKIPFLLDRDSVEVTERDTPCMDEVRQVAPLSRAWDTPYHPPLGRCQH